MFLIEIYFQLFNFFKMDQIESFTRDEVVGDFKSIIAIAFRAHGVRTADVALKDSEKILEVVRKYNIESLRDTEEKKRGRPSKSTTDSAVKNTKKNGQQNKIILAPENDNIELFVQSRNINEENEESNAQRGINDNSITFASRVLVQKPYVLNY